MMPNKYNLEVGASTETGYVRSENQDRMSWASIPMGQLYIVADGMGGHAGGAKAAALTIEGLEQTLKSVPKKQPVETAIRNAFEKTNKDVYDQAHLGDPAMAFTAASSRSGSAPCTTVTLLTEPSFSTINVRTTLPFSFLSNAAWG